MKSLAQKIFDICPDWLKVRIFELSDEEKFFLEVLKDKKMMIRDYVCSEETETNIIAESRHINDTMKFLLDRYEKGSRFYRYFSKRAESLNQEFQFVLRYH